MSKYYNVLVYVDDDMPEYMDGLIRIADLNFFKEDGQQIELEEHEEFGINLNVGEMINAEYHSANELIKDVAARLGIEPSQVDFE
ncbi:hypothetical protein ACQKNS_24445 [Peribacillus sp. NPDC094092]|uniref:hypothetical protein n=1 Tax=Peribacillus sp. NPDC094092 TaxID=3390611 RepID=UPI003D0713ED